MLGDVSENEIAALRSTIIFKNSSWTRNRSLLRR